MEASMKQKIYFENYDCEIQRLGFEHILATFFFKKQNIFEGLRVITSAHDKACVICRKK